ncbi:MAG: hypothetical protein R3F61_36195 [Myxococcota bacterium]
MIGVLGLLGVALAAPDRAAAVHFERVDLVSEDPGRWLVDEVPRTLVSPRGTALRWVEQVKVAFAVPRASLVVGASVTSQSVAVRRPLTHRAPVYGQVGVTTALGLPRGVLVGLEAWRGPVRLGIGVHAHANATWARPVYDTWRVLPGVGIGIGRSPSPF